MLSASVIDNIVIIDIKRFKYYNLYGNAIADGVTPDML